MLTAAALAAVVAHGAGVTQLAGETVVAVHHFTVDHDTGTYSGTQGDHDEVLHTTGGAVCHFTHSGGVGVVGEGNGNAVHGFLQHLGEFHAVVAPLQIGSGLDAAGIVVAVGGAYADTTNLTLGLGLGDDMVKGFCQGGNKGSGFFVIVASDNGLCENGAAGVYDAAFGGLSTYINTNY